MRHVLPALLFFTVVASGAVADEEPAALDQSLASSFGGLTESDELPAFGDAELQTPAFQPDPKFTDPVKRGGLQRAETVVIAIMWGYLAPHPDATEVVDWSGSITVTNAAVRVLRTLRFNEEGESIDGDEPDVWLDDDDR